MIRRPPLFKQSQLGQSKQQNLMISKPIQDDKHNDDFIQSEFHSLIIEHKPEEHIPLETDDGIIPDIFQHQEAHSIFKMYLGDFGEEGVGLHEIFDKLNNSKYSDYLELHIDSHGGYVSEGKQFYNIINNKFTPNACAGFLNQGYSMGALVFCMCGIRVVHEFSALMFHDYSGGMYGKGGDLESYHVHTSKHIRNFFRKVIMDRPEGENAFLTPEEFELLIIGKEFWMDAQEMLQRGIATHILTENGMIPAKEYLKPKTTKTSKAKKTKVVKVAKVKEATQKTPDTPDAQETISE